MRDTLRMPHNLSEGAAPGLRNGLLGWAVIAVVIVLLRGLRWDENYEFAQVMNGQIPYPADHPLYQYTRSFFSLQPWSLTAVMTFAPGPFFANFLRNTFMLWATVLPAYAMTFGIARRPVFAHAAVLLTLAGIHTQFFSNYPVQIWPDIYSNGHIGQGWALMTLACWLLRCPRTGWLLFGFMPAVHLGQFPPLAICGAFLLAWLFLRGRYRELGTALRCLAPGIMVAVLLWLLVHVSAPPSPSTGAWMADVDPVAVLQGYLTHFASHRSLPSWSGHIPLVLLVTVICVLGRSSRARIPLYTYVGALAVLAWGIALTHAALGGGTPEILLRWMPYRILNHAAPILIALAFGILARVPAAGHRLAGLLLLSLLLRPVAARILPDDFYARYLGGGEAWLFLLAGAALASAAAARREPVAWLAPLILVMVLLASGHQFGAAALAAGAVIYCGLTKLPTSARLRRLPAAMAVMLLLLLAFQQWTVRRHLPRSDFDAVVSAHFAAHDARDAMLLVPYQQEAMQACTGQPVMTDMATLTWIPYQPELGPGLWRMYRDLYGVDVAPGLAPPMPPHAWHEVWPSKTPDEWHALSKRYGFSHVAAPGFMALPLDPMLTAGGMTLYRVPQMDPAS